MSLVKEQNAFLSDVARLIVYAQSTGLVITAGELYRPQEMQEIYYKTGKSNTLNGQHQKRLAIDINFFKIINNKMVLTYQYENIEPIGIFWESLNVKNRWGGRFKKLVDTPHFERYV